MSISHLTEEEAQDRLTEIRKGRLVRVYKGRKTPVGTEGYVFWIGDGQYGPRIGMSDHSGDTHWVSMSNVAVVLPGVRFRESPPEGWVRYEESLKWYWFHYAQTLPQKGDKVLVPYPKGSGRTGMTDAEIVWTGYHQQVSRIGTKVADPQEEKTMWYSLEEVRLPSGEPLPSGPFPRKPLEGVLQPPFDRTCRVVAEGRTDAYRILDWTGKVVCRVPARTAEEISTRLHASYSKVELT